MAALKHSQCETRIEFYTSLSRISTWMTKVQERGKFELLTISHSFVLLQDFPDYRAVVLVVQHQS